MAANVLNLKMFIRFKNIKHNRPVAHLVLIKQITTVPVHKIFFLFFFEICAVALKKLNWTERVKDFVEVCVIFIIPSITVHLGKKKIMFLQNSVIYFATSKCLTYLAPSQSL